MNAEPTLNETSAKLKLAEVHAAACWAALERHIYPSPGLGLGRTRCGCGKLGGVITIKEGCDVGEACKEEYEIASRRVREMQATQTTLEPGDFEAVPS